MGSSGPPAPGTSPLRAWLEPGYDGGRVGAWALDAPGVFAWGHDADRARTGVLTQTARVREWLEARGDTLGLPMLGRVEIVEEVPVRVEPGGYEANATFEPDRRPLAADEAEVAIRRLGWLREDLLHLAGRVSGHEAVHGGLPADTPAGERTADGVLRHLAGTEVWLVGRLDGARYDGPLDGSPTPELLAATRQWAVARLRELARADDGREVADRHGETWTATKVTRRLLYHAIDHLWELDRRLARADGTAGRIEVTLEHRPSAPELAALLRAVGWDGRAKRLDSLETIIDASTEFATAWDGPRLVGTARSLTDLAMNAYVAMVVVHPRYQGLGVGERVVRSLMDGRDHVRFSLSAAPGMAAWYRKLGYEPDPQAMTRNRR